MGNATQPERNTVPLNFLVKPSLKRRVERYAEETGVTQAEAVRFLIDRALSSLNR